MTFLEESRISLLWPVGLISWSGLHSSRLIDIFGSHCEGGYGSIGVRVSVSGES